MNSNDLYKKYAINRSCIYVLMFLKKNILKKKSSLSISYIAENFFISMATVKRCLKILSDKNIILWETKFNSDGGRLCNTYSLHPDLIKNTNKEVVL